MLTGAYASMITYSCIVIAVNLSLGVSNYIRMGSSRISSSCLVYIAVPLAPIVASLWATLYSGIIGSAIPLTLLVSHNPMISGLYVAYFMQ